MVALRAKRRPVMSDSTPPRNSSSAGRSAPAPAEGSRIVPPDYGMPGSKGMDNPLKPLVWLLLPFFFCLVYGILTR